MGKSKAKNLIVLIPVVVALALIINAVTGLADPNRSPFEEAEAACPPGGAATATIAGTLPGKAVEREATPRTIRGFLRKQLGGLRR